MRLRTLVRIDKSARRLAEIFAVLAKYGLGDWLSGIDYDWLRGLLKRSADGAVIPDLTTNERIRSVLTELGPGFIKLGQILSTRPDLIGPDLTDELGKLQSNAPADPFDRVRAAVEAEFGRPLGELFASFDEAPIASASIGQVHGATLADGLEVVVKVMHDGIEASLRRDLDLLVGIAELADTHAPQLRRNQPLATARDIERTLLRELDFAHERRHLEKFAENFAGDPHVRFPEVRPELCGQRVLTMERFRGVPVNDGAGLRASGEDLSAFAGRGGRMYLDMIFRDGFYHADPHPGNLFLLAGGVVGVIDCGMVGQIDEDLRQDIEEMLMAAVANDSRVFTDLVMRIGRTPPELDEDALRAEIESFLNDYTAQSIAEFDVSGALQRMFSAFREFRIVLPRNFAMLVKTLILLDGTAKRLSPDFSLAALIAPYCRRTLHRRLAPRRLFADLHRGYRDWRRLAGELPRDLADILTRFRKGTLEVHMEHRRLESTVDRLVMGLLTSAMFLGSAMMWSMAAPPLVFGVSLFGAVGFAVSVVMGARLIFSVRRAHRGKGRRR
ncbi:MAG: AarF/ABC1/UbiB kinase family protein [Verrucomicrobiae bacterium]|nr:AarF/ABC1/UbiB kinase family protein [Verrucomicrobiae bacterium]